MQRKLGALCLSILILATGHAILECAFPSFGAHAVCCWNIRSSIQSRGIMTAPKDFSSPHLPRLGERSSLLPEIMHLSSTIRYIHVLSACTCLCFVHVLYVFCLPPAPLPVLALYSEPSCDMLRVILGSLIREPWAGLCCSGCHILAPCAVSGLGISVSCTSWRAPVNTGASTEPWRGTCYFTQWLCQGQVLTALGDLHSFLFL